MVYVPVKIRTASNAVVTEVLGVLFAAEIFQRVRPEQIAHGAERRRLFEPVQLEPNNGKWTRDNVKTPAVVLSTA